MNEKAAALLGVAIIVASIIFGIVYSFGPRYQVVTDHKRSTILLDMRTGDSWWRTGDAAPWQRNERPR